MKRIIFLAILIAACAAGCPATNLADPPIQPVIGLSASRGRAPLPVVFSAADSISARPITRYVWDLGGEEIVEGVSVSHTFFRPGRYDITLTITDESGASATARATVRVEGGAVHAQLDADRTSGVAPLLVRFDAGGSNAEDDTIRDYFWDFGDGASSRQRAPAHLYERAGTFTVRLRVVSAGGIEGVASTTIEVGSPDPGSLAFDGSQFATLPLDAAQTLETWTFEARLRLAGDAGGRVLEMGSPPVSVELDPIASVVRVAAASGDAEIATAFDMTAGWFHFALTHDPADGLTAYFNGDAAASAAIDGATTVESLIVGATFQGNIIDVRFWSSARTPAQVQADAGGDVDPTAANLLGAWLLQDGVGQSLTNVISGGAPGVLGSSTAVEPVDPTWSDDTP